MYDTDTQNRLDTNSADRTREQTWSGGWREKDVRNHFDKKKKRKRMGKMEESGVSGKKAIQKYELEVINCEMEMKHRLWQVSAAPSSMTMAIQPEPEG